MIICIDITEMMCVEYMTGIQRVVKEITVRWLENNIEILLLVYDLKKKCFFIVDNKKYYDYYLGITKNRNMITRKMMRMQDFNHNHIFFDLDAVWMNPIKRSYLLPLLKENGTKIAVFIHDIIPVTEPQYCHEATVLWFMEFLGAHLQNADLLIASTKATISTIEDITGHTANYNTKVVKLGSNLKKTDQTCEIRHQISQLSKSADYVLMVGTLEPRKNHKYILQAFEHGLFEENVHLVLAGRVGWNIDTFAAYIRNHRERNKKLYFIEDASDAEISFLYKNALLVAFPSYNEGFGLPIIEALENGTIVLASDIPVLREVGGDYCKYFSLENEMEFIKLVRNYKIDRNAWKEEKEKIKHYKNYSWNECAGDMLKAIYDGIYLKA